MCIFTYKISYCNNKLIVEGRKVSVRVRFAFTSRLNQKWHQFVSVQIMIFTMRYLNDVTGFVQIMQCLLWLIDKELNFSNFHMEQAKQRVEVAVIFAVVEQLEKEFEL